MNIYRNWIDKMEKEGLANKGPLKRVHNFEWGLEYINQSINSNNPSKTIVEFVDSIIVDSQQYFTPVTLLFEDYSLVKNKITFQSSVSTPFSQNNIVTANYFPAKDKKNVIIVVPHWNAEGFKYDAMCKMMNKVNFSSIRLILPYHEERDPEGPADSTWMVSANIGLTLQALRQTVHDIISCVTWLKYSGFERIGILGASLGSCAAFLAAVHDSRINCFFANFMSSYFGDVVWTGESTNHIKKSLEPHVSLCEIRKYWLLNSPIAFIKKLKVSNPMLKQFIVSGKYDTTFRFELTKKIFDAYDENYIKYQKIVLPCGHYSLGRSWFKFIDAYLILKFFYNNLKRSKENE